MTAKERLQVIASQVQRQNDEEYSPDGKFVGGLTGEESVPQRLVRVRNGQSVLFL